MLETPADQPLADSRRAVPRTDTVLAEPAVRAATERLGATIVKDAVRRAQDRCRRGELAPDEVPVGRRGVAAARRHGPAPGAQRDRRGGAHQPGTGAALPCRGRGARAGRRRDRRRARPRHRSPGSTRALGARRARRRGAGRRRRARGQQRRSRARAGHRGTHRDRSRSARRGGDRPRRARRDRRRLPDPRAAGVRGRPAARGRHHQPGARRGLPRRPRGAHRLRAQGASLQLPRLRLHLLGGAAGARPSCGRARRPAGGRHRLRAARPAPTGCPTSRAPRTPCGPAPTWSPPRATSCWADPSAG